MITVSPDVILCGWLGSKHQQRKNMITAGSFIIIPRRFSHIPAACADIGVLPVNLQNVHPPFVAGQVSTPLSKHVGHVYWRTTKKKEEKETITNIMRWWLFHRLRGFFSSTIHSSAAFFFKNWRLARTDFLNSLCQDQPTVAQRAETTVAECSLKSCVWARFQIGSYTVPGQRYSQPTPTSLGQGCMRV